MIRRARKTPKGQWPKYLLLDGLSGEAVVMEIQNDRITIKPYRKGHAHTTHLKARQLYMAGHQWNGPSQAEAAARKETHE